MPRPYSVDLRERVVVACERGGGSLAAVARRFAVSASTVRGWGRLARVEGRRAPRRMGGHRKPLGGADPAVLAAVVAERRDATLAEYADALAARLGRRFSLAAVCRALQRAGLPRKKRRSAPASRSAPTSPPNVPLGVPRLRARSVRSASSSSMRAVPTPA
jgi:transposase